MTENVAPMYGTARHTKFDECDGALLSFSQALVEDFSRFCRIVPIIVAGPH